MLQVDLLKGMAIVGVVILHGLSSSTQASVGASFHIAQAVPVFFLLMAFNAQRSFLRMPQSSSLGDVFRSGFVVRRLQRLLGPLAIAVAVSGALQVMRGESLRWGWESLALSLPVPLPGQFFVAVSVAFSVLAPFLLVAYRHAPTATVLACVVTDLAFELTAPHLLACVDSYYLYQVVPFRFAALFGLGLWLANDARPFCRRNWFIVPYALASVAYLWGYALGFRGPFVNMEHVYNVVEFGWPLLIVSVGLTWLPPVTSGRVLGATAEVGRASYHIFLVQGVWFALGADTLPIGGWGWDLARMAAGLMVCLLFGWSWYRFDCRRKKSGDLPGRDVPEHR